MYEKNNEMDYVRDRRMSKALTAKAMEDPRIELEFFQNLDSMEKPDLADFMKRLEQEDIKEERKQRFHSYEPIYAGEKRDFFREGKSRRCLKIAGLFLTFLFLSAVATSFIKLQPSTAGKITLELSGKEVKNGFVEDSHLGTEQQQALEEVIEDEKYIPAMKEKYKELVVPEYIPQGYVFESLTVNCSNSGSFGANYIYKNNKIGQLVITQKVTGDNGFTFGNFVADFEELEKGALFYQEDRAVNGVSILLAIHNSNSISISASLEKEELLKIETNIKY